MDRKTPQIIRIRMEGATVPLHLMGERIENQEVGTCSKSHTASEWNSQVRNSSLPVPLPTCWEEDGAL